MVIFHGSNNQMVLKLDATWNTSNTMVCKKWNLQTIFSFVFATTVGMQFGPSWTRWFVVANIDGLTVLIHSLHPLAISLRYCIHHPGRNHGCVAHLSPTWLQEEDFSAVDGQVDAFDMVGDQVVLRISNDHDALTAGCFSGWLMKDVDAGFSLWLRPLRYPGLIGINSSQHVRIERNEMQPLWLFGFESEPAGKRSIKTYCRLL